MIYFIGSVAILLFIIVFAPFQFFPDKMEGYGSYLTGLAAIGAALKFIMPYLLVLFYQKRYANELIWKEFLDTSSPEDEGRVAETEWIAGLINYFRRCEEVLHKESSWYQKIPYLSDDVYVKFSGKRLIGKKEGLLFEEIKSLFFECGEIVAMNSTPDKPMFNEEKYKLLHEKFKSIVKKSDAMSKLLVDTPIPVKKIIEGDDFFKSFFGKR